MIPPFDIPDQDRTHEDTRIAGWLAKAAGDLDTAAREIQATTRPNFDAVCFHAQQAAEKVMQAVLVARDIIPPKTHDLVELDAILAPHAAGWRWDKGELTDLSLSAVGARYSDTCAGRTEATATLAMARGIWALLRPKV